MLSGTTAPDSIIPLDDKPVSSKAILRLAHYLFQDLLFL